MAAVSMSGDEEEAGAESGPDWFPEEAVGAPIGDPELYLSAWASAEARAIGPIAEVAGLLGRLEERIRMGAPTERLICGEAAAMIARADRPMRIEALAMHMQGRQPSSSTGGRALRIAAWIADRFAGDLDFEAPAALMEWLGREYPAPAMTPAGEEALAAWTALARAASGLTPLARGAALAGAWAREPAFGRWRTIVAPVLGARIAGRAPLGFIPLAFGAEPAKWPIVGGTRPFDPAEDLSAWLGAASRAAAAMLDDLAALERWRAATEASFGRAQAGGERAMVEVVYRRFAVSAASAARTIGYNRDTAERALSRMEAQGAVREITGNGRWRFWTAAV